MPEPKEKPRMEKPKAKKPSVLSPKQVLQLLTSNHRSQLERRIPGEENETEHATDRTESAAKRTAEELTCGLPHFPDRKQRMKVQRQASTEQRSQPPREQAARNNRCRALMEKSPPSANETWQAIDSSPAVSLRQVGISKERPHATAATIKTRENIKATAKVSGGADITRIKLRRSKATAQVLRRTRQNAQRQTTRRMVTQARKTVRTSVILMKKAAVAVTKAVAKMIGSLAGFAGGGILLIIVVMVFVVATIGNSPFGIFFAAERSMPNTVSVCEAVSMVNTAYNAKLEELQSGNFDSIVIQGQAAEWSEVLAVFAVKTAGVEDGVDAVTLDTDRVKRLTDVFEDMTVITTRVEETDHPSNGDNNPERTEHVLHIIIKAKTTDEMRTQYSFTRYQNSALDELLEERDALTALVGSLTITNADVSAVLDALPDDLSTERREVVTTALTLVGKVNYFWGGKSSAIGWDSRWGTLRQVTAAGSSTTGTYRPYGLDCSGWVDWVFNNSLGYVIGHGGGAATQHIYCTNIPWDEAQPGDLAFFSDDSHVGIVVGRSDTNGILVAHCSSGNNNVVITDYAASGFTAIGRPDIFD